jgi:macrolide transport system ATP-binding/permease protein
METAAQNLRYALRQLARNPGFTVTVLLTLALSIGANTAIFSLVNALLLKSLPYPHPERLGTIYARTTGPESYDRRKNLDGADWEELRDNVPALLSAVTAGLSSGVNIQAGKVVQYLHGGRVSAHYLEILGIQPLLGRNFSTEEDAPHGPRSAILSYNLWRNTFNANPNILGQTILLKGEPYTVIGVLPQNAVTPLNADLYTALQPSREGEGGGTNFDNIVRLRDGATWAEADAQLARAWAARIARFASNNPGATATFYTVPLQKGETGTLGPRVLALMSAAGFILLIACANLAGLALVRTLRRAGEIATRLALGASSWQIQKQLWIENLVLALLGGAAGVGVGFLALRGLLHLLPEHFLPVASVGIDYRVLAFTLLLALATSLLFGMLPALATRKVDLRSSIAAHATSAGGVRMRQALIAGEIALTVVLLAAAGLLIRTLVHLETLPAAFNPNGVLTAKASLDDARYHDPAAFQKLLDQSVAAMRQISGVENAAVGLTLPYERTLNSGVTFNDGPNAGRQAGSDLIYATPGYFATLQIPIFAGRDFSASDTPTTQPVAIVNQAFARKFFHGDNPVGHILNKNLRIIGIVGDTTLASGLSDDPSPLMSEETMYIPASQVDPKLLALVHVWFQPSWIVRTNHPMTTLTEHMQRALASVDPNLPFSGFYSMSDLMAQTLAIQRIQVALLGAMAGLALLLSTIGIFALVANLVVQRTREIGIRIALGSSIRGAMLQVGQPGITASLIGLVTGLVLSAAVLRAMSSVLYGVQVYDAPTIAAVIATLAAVTLLAVTLPTLRIAKIDPAKTLREE